MTLLHQQQQYSQNRRSPKMTSILQSSVSVPISPTSLTKLCPTDAARLYEYIMAIQKENKSRNQQRIFMEKYLEGLKAELDQYGNASRVWRNKEGFFNSEIYRLSHDNMAIMGELRGREDRIMELEQEIDRLNTLCIQNQQRRQQKQNEFTEQINRMVQQQKLLSQTSSSSSLQLQDLQKNNSSLAQQLEKQKNKNIELENRYKSLELENDRFREQLLQLSTELKNREVVNYQQSTRTQEDLARIQEQKRQTEKEIRVLAQKLQSQSRKNQELQLIIQGMESQIDKYQQQLVLKQQLEETVQQLERKYKGESEQWSSKQKDVEQFVAFIKNNIREMESTIEAQALEIETLRRTNQRLKEQILENIAKMNAETDNRKSRELADLKIELASYKGKLAEKERQLSTSSSKMAFTPMEEYSLRVRMGTEEVEEDKESMTYSDRNKTFISNKSITNGAKSRRIKNFNSQNTIVNS